MQSPDLDNYTPRSSVRSLEPLFELHSRPRYPQPKPTFLTLAWPQPAAPQPTSCLPCLSVQVEVVEGQAFTFHTAVEGDTLSGLAAGHSVQEEEVRGKRG